MLSPGAQQGHTGSDPGPGWWLALASLIQVSPAAGTQVHGACGSGPAADIRAPPHMHTSWGVPQPGEELEMEFNERQDRLW